MAASSANIRSPWSVHFIREDGKSAVCKICKVKVMAPTSNTSNLKNHLKVKHKDIFRKIEKNIADKNATKPTTTQAIKVFCFHFNSCNRFVLLYLNMFIDTFRLAI